MSRLNRSEGNVVLTKRKQNAIVQSPNVLQQQRLQQTTTEGSLQRLLETSITPPKELLRMVTESVGPAEAEIEYVERIHHP